MSKVYSFEEGNKVISDAWRLAVKHLEDTLGDQYKCNVTENAMEKFWDYVQQDIEYKMVCPKCGEVDDEGNFMSHRLYKGGKKEVCYSCYEDLGEE